MCLQLCFSLPCSGQRGHRDWGSGAEVLQWVSGVWVMLSGGTVVVLAQRGLALSPHWAATVPYAGVI